MLSSQTNPPSRRKGFTIIELMVTVGIFVFMTALVLYRYNSYYSGTLFSNLAYDIALTIRQAQTYGISVRVAQDTPINFKAAYGVHFDKSSNDNFILFADLNNNGYFDYDHNGTLGDDLIENRYYLKHGAKINQLYYRESNSSDYNPVDVLDISFERPEPMAIICYKIVSPASSGCGKNEGKIELISGDSSAIKRIQVFNVGQIVVRNGS